MYGLRCLCKSMSQEHYTPYSLRRKTLGRLFIDRQGRRYKIILQGRLYRLQNLRKELSVGCNYRYRQCGVHKLRSLHRLRNMRGKMSEKDNLVSPFPKRRRHQQAQTGSERLKFNRIHIYRRFRRYFFTNLNFPSATYTPTCIIKHTT